MVKFEPICVYQLIQSIRYCKEVFGKIQKKGIQISFDLNSLSLFSHYSFETNNVKKVSSNLQNLINNSKVQQLLFNKTKNSFR